MNPIRTKNLLMIFCFLLFMSNSKDAFRIHSNFPFNNKEVEIENLERLNSKGIDFCAVPFDGGVVFTSSRNQEDGTGLKNMINKNYFDLYYAKINSKGKFFEPNKLKGDINGKLHDGTATFSASGEMMFFTRNEEKEGGSIQLKIYTAQRVEGYWINVKELPVNVEGSSTCHPTLSADGNKIYFASDRSGGFGGMDLYVSILKDGVWGTPENLGINVNSAGNELFPFMDKSGNLYYASNDTGGQGKLDIYYAQKDGKRFKQKRNIGEPFNSPADDFGFFISENEEEGFLSSNRDGGFGSDDVYSWKLVEEPVVRKIKVMDRESGQMISEAVVMIEENSGDNDFIIVEDDKDGVYPYEVQKADKYHISIEKEGFANYNSIWQEDEFLDKEEHIIYLRKQAFTLLSGKVKGQVYKKEMENVDIELMNECTGETEYVKTKKDGSFDFNLTCGCEYIIIAKNKGFMTRTKIITKEDNPCMGGSYLKKEILMQPAPNSSFPRASIFD